MKILEIYDKDSDLRYRRKNVFERMDNFFLKFPKEYSDIYYKNLEELRIFRVDEFPNGIVAGQYDMCNNILLFKEFRAIGHELFHMASYDGERFAFQDKVVTYEYGLMEGMTEYLFTKAFNLSKPTAYFFETFCVEMLTDIEEIFKHYFIPNHNGFVNLFPNKKDIYSLMYSLDFFSATGVYFASDEEKELVSNVIRRTIRDVINKLIDIELSYDKNDKELLIYSEKFMDLISSEIISCYLCEVYPRYKNYANRVVNKRIRSKIKN